MLTASLVLTNAQQQAIQQQGLLLGQLTSMGSASSAAVYTARTWPVAKTQSPFFLQPLSLNSRQLPWNRLKKRMLVNQVLDTIFAALNLLKSGIFPQYSTPAPSVFNLYVTMTNHKKQNVNFFSLEGEKAYIQPLPPHPQQFIS